MELELDKIKVYMVVMVLVIETRGQKTVTLILELPKNIVDTRLHYMITVKSISNFLLSCLKFMLSFR